jgi:fatty acid desaturase
MDLIGAPIMEQTPTALDVELSPRWQERFDFFAEYGPPNTTPESRAAIRALPFGKRMVINQNYLAFFFSPFYFFVKGMWRKGLALAGAALALAIAATLLPIPELAARGLSGAVPALAMTSANYAYFLHVTTGSTSWNPFEGLGRRSAGQRR